MPATPLPCASATRVCSTSGRTVAARAVCALPLSIEICTGVPGLTEAPNVVCTVETPACVAVVELLFVPATVPGVRTADARPRPSVLDDVGATEPPPLTVQLIVASGTTLLNGSRTSATSANDRVAPAVSACASPETRVIAAGGPARPVASNRMG